MRRVRVGRIRLEGDIVHLGEGVGSERGVGRKELPDVKRRCRVVALGLKPLPFAFSPFRGGFPGIRASGGRSGRRGESGGRLEGTAEAQRFGVAGARRPGALERGPVLRSVGTAARARVAGGTTGATLLRNSYGGQARPGYRSGFAVLPGFLLPCPEGWPQKAQGALGADVALPGVYRRREGHRASARKGGFQTN